MQPPKERLETLVNEWKSIGLPDQEGFPWLLSKPKWDELASDFNVNIEEFPELIDRQFLWKLSSSSAPAQVAFLAVMIWGYGDIGYGPYRVRQMFESEGFEQSLELVKALCHKGETLEAYKALKDSRIRQLGPSFGSKVLTFFHEPQSAPPIMDSIVADWLKKHAPDLHWVRKVNAETWNLSTYESYLKWISDASVIYQVTPCSLELLIFTDGYGA